MKTKLKTALKSTQKRPEYTALGLCAELSTDTRFVLVGHTVRVIVDYDGLSGALGVVIGPDLGDGKLLLRIGERRVCFLSREVEFVVDGGNYSHYLGSSEEGFVSGRVEDLWWDSRHLATSAAVREALIRRRQKVLVDSRALARERLARDAFFYAKHGLSCRCTALVPYVQVESGVAA